TFLFAKVLAPDHGQQLILANTIAPTERPTRRGRIFLGFGRLLPLRRAQRHDLTGKPAAYARHAVAIEVQVSGQWRQIPRTGRLLDLGELQTDGGRHVARDLQRVSADSPYSLRLGGLGHRSAWLSVGGANHEEPVRSARNQADSQEPNQTT